MLKKSPIQQKSWGLELAKEFGGLVLSRVIGGIWRGEYIVRKGEKRFNLVSLNGEQHQRLFCKKLEKRIKECRGLLSAKVIKTKKHQGTRCSE